MSFNHRATNNRLETALHRFRDSLMRKKHGAKIRDANSALFRRLPLFSRAVWVTCVNRVDPMSCCCFFLGGGVGAGGGGVWEGLRV